MLHGNDREGSERQDGNLVDFGRRNTCDVYPGAVNNRREEQAVGSQCQHSTGGDNEHQPQQLVAFF